MTRAPLPLALRPLLLAWALGACSDGAGMHGRQPGETQACGGGEERVVLDCSSEVSYQGTSGEAGINVMNIGNASGKFEEKAIRRVGDQVEQFVAIQTRACRDYNACVMDRDQYRAQTDQIRDRMQTLPALLEALKSAQTESERSRALDALYRGIVPDEQRDEEITFHLGIAAALPREVGGAQMLIGPGDALPTGAAVSFTVSSSQEAHVYMFQTAPSGEVSVLFPDPEIGTQNPLPGGLPARIPPAGQDFRLNDKDIGVENVYIVVSRKPLDDMNAALDRVKGGQTRALNDDPLLRRVSTVVTDDRASGCKVRALELAPSATAEKECSRPRGLQLTGKSAGAPRGLGSLSVRTAPGDDMIVRVFPFRHMTVAEYKKLGPGGTRGHPITE